MTADGQPIALAVPEEPRRGGITAVAKITSDPGCEYAKPLFS
jgi:hypothetical protein